MKKITWMMLVSAVMMGSLSGGAEALRFPEDRQEGESRGAYNRRMIKENLRKELGIFAFGA